MTETNIYREFEERGNKAAEDVARRAVNDRRIRKWVFASVLDGSKRVKNAAGKTLRTMSELDPRTVYPNFDFFVGLMDGDDTILKWLAMDVIGNLASVDADKKIEKSVVDRFLKLLFDPQLVTATHAVENLGKIALHKPRYQREITSKILKAGRALPTDECRAILAGKVIDALGDYFERMKKSEREMAVAYARRQLKSRRPATVKKTEIFLRECRENS